MTQNSQSRIAARIKSLLGIFFIGLPLLSAVLSLLAWLTYGIDIPYMDDWRPYILNEAGTFAPDVLFRPTNDTMSPVGLALDSAALRWLGGNSIAYQAVSMSFVLFCLLTLQWLLLRHVLRNTALTACAFCLSILMLQPGSYWGEQNLAFHQAIPLICILASLYLVITREITQTGLVVSLLILGLISGFTYISGAFGYLVCGVVVAICAMVRRDVARSRMMVGGIVMATVGAATSIPQAWGLLFYQKGTHRADAPIALPYESDFWFYMLGKIGRSMLLPVSHPIFSLAIIFAVAVLLTGLLCIAFRHSRRVSVDNDNGTYTAFADGFAITLTLCAVVTVYLFMVSAGRANLRDPSMVDNLHIFAFGYLRFHFFWATLLWPWLAALLLVHVSSRTQESRLGWVPYIVVTACIIHFVCAGALNHFKSFRHMSVSRSQGVDCLRKASDDMKPMICTSIELRDLRPALQVAERSNATFTRNIRSGASSTTPSEGTNTGIIRIEPGTFVDGNFLADRSGRISSIAIPIGNFGGLSDGELEISVCNTLRCVAGRSDLSVSLDNNYIEVRFDDMLIAEEGTQIPFRIRTMNANYPVAVWMTTRTEGSAQILRVHSSDGSDKTLPDQTIRIEAWYTR